MTGQHEESSEDQRGALEEYAAEIVEADNEAEEQFVEQMMAATMAMPPAQRRVQLVLTVMAIAIVCPPERRAEAAAQIAELLDGPRSDRSRT